VVDSVNVGRPAGNAMAHLMYPYTFGIVSDFQGVERRGLGTGVGVRWREKFLVATARHVIKDTPPQRVYLPSTAAYVAGSGFLGVGRLEPGELWTSLCSGKPTDTTRPLP
jgi:hypothetical protein